MTMRPTILSVLLLIAVPSMAQRGTDPNRSAPDSVVCFTMQEAELIHDTLWSAVNHRRARVVAAAMIGNLEQQLDAALRREQDQRSRADRLASGEGQAFAEVDQLKRDVAFWKRKANARGWRAFFAGLILGGGAGYGANELRP